MKEQSVQPQTRINELDIFRGLLIIFVVVGHSEIKISNIIFLFHMPAFFILSGMLLSMRNDISATYVLKKAKSIMIPYFFFGIIDVLFVRKKIKHLALLIYGGRSITGVYWYPTCFIATLFVFYLIKKFCSEKVLIMSALIGGVLPQWNLS